MINLFVFCGDFNVAHKEIDLAHPKANFNKTAGYTQKEIDGMDRLIREGFVDTFRLFYPGETGSIHVELQAGARSKISAGGLTICLVSNPSASY